MSIGSKIKALRKAQGMTQQELSAGIITRGMLSRIEGENATPSIQSLIALAEKLEVSPSFLLEEGEDISPAEQTRVAIAIEREFGKKNFRHCLDILEVSGLARDKKFAGFFASCAFDIAVEAFKNGDFVLSKKLLSEVEDVLDSLILIPNIINKARIRFMQDAMDNIDDIDKTISSISDSPDFGFMPSLFFFLLKLIYQDKVDACKNLMEFCTLDKYSTDILNAQILIKNYKLVDAIILTKYIAQDENCPVFLKLIAIKSNENCCKLCEDYKGAYDNHLAYQEMLNSIQR